MTQAGSTRASYPPLVMTGSGMARDPSRASGIQVCLITVVSITVCCLHLGFLRGQGLSL